MNTEVTFISHLELANLLKKDKTSLKTLSSQNRLIITYGDISNELKNSIHFYDFLLNDQELVLSSLPIYETEFNSTKIQKLMRASNWNFNYPVGLISSSFIKTETIYWHLLSCSECNCNIEDIVASILNSGLRQIFTSDVIDFRSEPENRINHPVMNEIMSTLRVLQDGIRLAIDGERVDPNNTGTNRVAIELISELAKSEFISTLDILIPMGYSQERIDLKSEIVRVGPLGRNLKKYDVLFRPYQTWEVSWLENFWNKFEVHIQWWLDFISFETPEYAGGLPGLSKNLENAIWAFNHFDSTLFLSPSCKEKAKCIGENYSSFDDVLPCTVGLDGLIDSQSKEKIILIVGNSFKHKSRVFALRVFEKIIEIDPEFQLVMIGGDPGFATSNEVEEKILLDNDLLRSRVINLGKANDITLFEYYVKSMFLFSPSTVEGFGLVPFEAAKYGVTPLTSKIDAWRDYLELEYWLDLYSLDNSANLVLELAQSIEKRNQQISKFVDWSTKHDWEFLSNKSILHFGRTLARLRKQGHGGSSPFVVTKNSLKRSRIFPILVSIKARLAHV